MADALLGIVIENLGSLVREEVADFMNIGKLTQKLSGNLTAIRAVLRDAEEKQITSHAVKDWLKKLIDAAHVLDDILEEASIQSAHGSTCVDNPFHLIKRILARRDIGKRVKEIAERFDDIAEERRRFELHAGSLESKPEDDEWRQTTSVITEPKVYGRDHDRERAVEFLLRYAIDTEELFVYSIFGLGGHGKTTLAQLIFNDDRVRKHFDLKIWVCVSDDFSMMKILKSIIESVTGESPNLLTLESMQQKVQQVLQNRRYLLVLDDVWNEDQGKWEKFKLFMQCGNGTKGAAMLVTTRLETVASMTGTYPDHRHRLSGLSENDIWSLFKHHAFGSSNEERAELLAIGKDIVGKCVGSPLAAKALGSLLRFKNEEHQWLAVKESKIWNLPEDNPIMKALRLSYFNLKLSLRPCFSFCAIFPKDFVMIKQDMIHLWMANGFISSRGNLKVEQVGSEVWIELYQRSFFQEVNTDEYGKITFKMHDLVHDLAESIMGDECVVSEFASFTNLSRRVHHIGCSSSNKQVNYKKIPFKKVESLRTFLELDPWDLNLHVLPSICTLRALRTSSFQLSTLKNFIHLRYLELYESYIITLPESVCELHTLQILKLERCFYLSSIPQHLTQLQDLRHLVIKGCPRLASMPSQMGKLTCLKTLSIFIVGSKERYGLAELHDLQLGGKLHIRGLENVASEWDARQANLAGKKELNRLYLSWGRQRANAECIAEALEPHSGLKGFGMKAYGGTQLPKWMGNISLLRGLVDLILYDCKNCQRLPPLGKLPCLTNLFIAGMKNVKYIDHDLYDPAAEKAFTSLKKLTLRDLPNLERILEVEDEGLDMLQLLSDLNISGVPKLALPSLPSVHSIFAQGGYENVDIFPSEVLRSMHRLKKLTIWCFNKLKVLSDELGCLGELEDLQISSCDELESFPEYVMQGLSSLRSLSICWCPKFKSFSEGMGHLTSLETLEIIGCSPQLVLPSNMNRLTTLREVTIQGKDNINTMLPEGLERIPSSLQILKLVDFSSLTSLPNWLGLMTSLQKLEIVYCPELRSLPDSLKQLRNLCQLRIYGCPRLEKRCKKGTGEDWPKIAHVPDLITYKEPTFCDKVIKAWKMRKQYSLATLSNYPENEFNEMVDKL